MKINDREFRKGQPDLRRGDSNPLNESRVYKSADLYLSAYLRTKGLIYLGAELEAGKVFFIFRDRDDIEQLVQDYFNGGLISALGYKNSLRDLKGIIMETRAKEKFNGKRIG